MKYLGSKHYEIHVDDTILCLNRLTRNKDIYNSIFEEPILKEYKRIHDLYGTVFDLSLFYRIDANTAFSVPLTSEFESEIGWTLSEMTDKFKSEFIANSSWIKFGFHSYSYDIRYNEPSGIARDAGQDYSLVRQEVYRFAGSSSWNHECNKLHWYSADKTRTQQIVDQGVKIMICNAMHAGTFVPYHFNKYMKNELFRNGTYYDIEMDCLFVIGAGVVERIRGLVPHGVEPPMGMYDYLNKFSTYQNPKWYKTCEYLSFETHEVWFCSDAGVVPEYEEIARWCYDNGYTPKFITKDLMLPWREASF